MSPLYPPSHLHCMQSFEQITLVEQIGDQIVTKEVFFIGEQDGKFTLLDEVNGFVEVANDTKTMFLVGHGHSPDQVWDRYSRESQSEQKHQRMNELKKTLGNKRERNRESFEHLL